MTLLVLGAIFCVLVVIARELRLLRRRGETPPTSAEQRHQPSAKYKPRIFTFERSGWTLRLVDLEEWVAIFAAVLIWIKFVLPLLPAQPWIKYPVTILGLIILSFLATFVVGILLCMPLGIWMDNHDQRVYNRVFTPEELKYVKFYAGQSDTEEMYRQKGL